MVQKQKCIEGLKFGDPQNLFDNDITRFSSNKTVYQNEDEHSNNVIVIVVNIEIKKSSDQENDGISAESNDENYDTESNCNCVECNGDKICSDSNNDNVNTNQMRVLK